MAYLLLCGLQRYMKKVCDVNIFDRDDPDFKRLYYTCENNFQELCADGVGSQSRPTEVPTPADKEKLWQTGILSVETPKGLLNAVFFCTMERTPCYTEELNRWQNWNTSELEVPFSPYQPLDSAYIEWIHMGTTVATNALSEMERKGERMVLQNSRDSMTCYTLATNLDPVFLICCMFGKDWTGRNSRKICSCCLDQGIRSLAVVLMHSYMFPSHEVAVGQLAREMGFTHVSLSSQIMPMLHIVPRGFTACADAYLTLHIHCYVQGFARITFMFCSCSLSEDSLK